jgi:hypothetical protein
VCRLFDVEKEIIAHNRAVQFFAEQIDDQHIPASAY